MLVPTIRSAPIRAILSGAPGPEPSLWERTGPEPSLWERTGPEPSLWESNGPEPSLCECSGPEPSLRERTGPEPPLGERYRPEPSFWARWRLEFAAGHSSAYGRHGRRELAASTTLDDDTARTFFFAAAGIAPLLSSSCFAPLELLLLRTRLSAATGRGINVVPSTRLFTIDLWPLGLGMRDGTRCSVGTELVVAFPKPAATAVRESSAGGSDDADCDVTDSDNTDSHVNGSDVAGSEISGSDVIGSDIIGSNVTAGTYATGSGDDEADAV
ncbi:unnamed protein product [Closterium sp. NIES-53]